MSRPSSTGGSPGGGAGRPTAGDLVESDGLPAPRGRGLLRTYLWWVVACALLTMVLVVLVVGHSPVRYTYSASVLVDSQPTQSGLLEPNMGNEKQIAESGRVARIVEDRLDITDPAEEAQLRAGLSVSAMVDTTVLTLDYTSTNEGQAADRAFAYSAAYIDYRNGQQTQRVVRLISAPHLTGRGTGESLVILGIIGLAVGAGLGLALAWTWDRVTDRLRGGPDLEQHSGLPVFARVPNLGGDLDLPWSGPRTRQTFAHLAARVLGHLGNPRNGIVVLVASARGGTGCTTVAFELAASLAGLGRRTVVVDGSGKNDGLGLRLDHAAQTGLSDVLAGTCPADSVVVPTPVQRLSLVPAGTLPAADGELDVDALNSALTRLASRAIVVVDGPPLLEDAGSLVLGGRADVILLVADEDSGTRADAQAAVALLKPSRDRVLGWVSNRPPRRRWLRLRRRGAGSQPPTTAEPPGDDALPVRDVESPTEPTSAART